MKVIDSMSKRYRFGNRTPIGKRLDFQPEIIDYGYHRNIFRNGRNTQSTHLKFGFVYKLNDRVGISVAPSIYYASTEIGKNGEPYKLSPIKPVHENKKDERQETVNGKTTVIPANSHSFGAGISIGVLFN
jgi:hypothetical protein